MIFVSCNEHSPPGVAAGMGAFSLSLPKVAVPVGRTRGGCSMFLCGSSNEKHNDKIRPIQCPQYSIKI